MSNFKNILKIEKKYEKIINDANKKVQSNMDKFLEDLKLKDDVCKQDYKKELERDFKRNLAQVRKSGEKELQSAKEESSKIKTTAKKEETIEFLMEEIKNV